MYLNWLRGGILLGAVFFLAVALVKPVGVSTQFVIFDGILWNALDSSLIEPATTKSGFTSNNAYLAKSGGKYAGNVMNPANYSFIFVLAMLAGAFVSARLRGGVNPQEKQMPEVWRKKFGDSLAVRYAAAFGAGFLVLYGARLAGGCTSGHMMSGIMQTAVSGYLFTLGAFGAGVPLAIWLYRKGGK